MVAEQRILSRGGMELGTGPSHNSPHPLSTRCTAVVAAVRASDPIDSILHSGRKEKDASSPDEPQSSTLEKARNELHNLRTETTSLSTPISIN